MNIVLPSSKYRRSRRAARAGGVAGEEGAGPAGEGPAAAGPAGEEGAGPGGEEGGDGYGEDGGVRSTACQCGIVDESVADSASAL